jgi:hypothetical protein
MQQDDLFLYTWFEQIMVRKKNIIKKIKTNMEIVKTLDNKVDKERLLRITIKNSEYKGELREIDRQINDLGKVAEVVQKAIIANNKTNNINIVKDPLIEKHKEEKESRKECMFKYMSNVAKQLQLSGNRYIDNFGYCSKKRDGKSIYCKAHKKLMGK